jgi:hypothetical protein
VPPKVAQVTAREVNTLRDGRGHGPGGSVGAQGGRKELLELVKKLIPVSLGKVIEKRAQGIFPLGRTW